MLVNATDFKSSHAETRKGPTRDPEILNELYTYGEQFVGRFGFC